MRALRVSLVASLLALSSVVPATVSAATGDVGVEGPLICWRRRRIRPARSRRARPGSTPGRGGAACGTRRASATRSSGSTLRPTPGPRPTSRSTRDPTAGLTRCGTARGCMSPRTSSLSHQRPDTRAKLYVFTYAAGVYSPAGSPTIINNVRSESLVIDKDSTGQLWATWVQGGSGARKVWVNRTTSGTIVGHSLRAACQRGQRGG